MVDRFTIVLTVTTQQIIKAEARADAISIAKESMAHADVIALIVYDEKEGEIIAKSTAQKMVEILR